MLSRLASRLPKQFLDPKEMDAAAESQAQWLMSLTKYVPKNPLKFAVGVVSAPALFVYSLLVAPALACVYFLVCLTNKLQTRDQGWIYERNR